MDLLRIFLVLLGGLALFALLLARHRIGHMEPWRARLFWGVVVFISGFCWMRLHWLTISLTDGPWEPGMVAAMPLAVQAIGLVLVITSLVRRR